MTKQQASETIDRLKAKRRPDALPHTNRPSDAPPIVTVDVDGLLDELVQPVVEHDPEPTVEPDADENNLPQRAPRVKPERPSVLVMGTGMLIFLGGCSRCSDADALASGGLPRACAVGRWSSATLTPVLRC